MKTIIYSKPISSSSLRRTALKYPFLPPSSLTPASRKNPKTQKTSNWLVERRHSPRNSNWDSLQFWAKIVNRCGSSWWGRANRCNRIFCEWRTPITCRSVSKTACERGHKTWWFPTSFTPPQQKLISFLLCPEKQHPIPLPTTTCKPCPPSKRRIHRSMTLIANRQTKSQLVTVRSELGQTCESCSEWENGGSWY